MLQVRAVVPGLLAVLAFGSCKPGGDSASPASRPAMTVESALVKKTSYPVLEEVIGTVRAKMRAAVEAKVSGRITNMAVDLGQEVQEGGLLVEIDAQEIKARLDQAAAARDQAQQDLKRFTTLLQKQVASRQEYDGAQARYRVADAAVREAETMMGYARVRAPFAGVVTRRLADTGDFASPGKALVEIENPSVLRFEADLPEALFGETRRGEKIAVRIPSLDKEILGTVAEIAPTADVASRTFLVRIELPPTKGLRAGQFGRAAIPVGEAAGLRVPAGAVVRRGQMEMVFVVDGGVARLRLVKTGKSWNDEVAILSGLESGETVVITKADVLADGQPVEIRP